MMMRKQREFPLHRHRLLFLPLPALRLLLSRVRHIPRTLHHLNPLLHELLLNLDLFETAHFIFNPLLFRSPLSQLIFRDLLVQLV